MSSSSYALCLKQLHKQPTYTVGYISVLQTLIFNPDIDSDVAAATIKMNRPNFETNDIGLLQKKNEKKIMSHCATQ